MAGRIEYDNDPNIICLNDAVILHSNRKGVVRYISDKTQNRIAVGIELTEPNPSGCDVSKLFPCKPHHGILIPLTQIARKIMPEELLMQLQIVTNKVNKYHKQIEELRKKIITNENQYASWITNQFLSANNNIINQRYNRNHNNRDYISHRGHSGHSGHNGYVMDRADERCIYDEISRTHTQHTQRTHTRTKTKKKQHRRHKTMKTKTQNNNSNRNLDYMCNDYMSNNNTISMSLNLKNEHRLHDIPTFTKEKEMSTSNNSMRRKRNLKRNQKTIKTIKPMNSINGMDIKNIKTQTKDQNKIRKRNEYLVMDESENSDNTDHSDGTLSNQSHFEDINT